MVLNSQPDCRDAWYLWFGDSYCLSCQAAFFLTFYPTIYLELHRPINHYVCWDLVYRPTTFTFEQFIFWNLTLNSRQEVKWDEKARYFSLPTARKSPAAKMRTIIPFMVADVCGWVPGAVELSPYGDRYPRLVRRWCSNPLFIIFHPRLAVSPLTNYRQGWGLRAHLLDPTIKMETASMKMRTGGEKYPYIFFFGCCC